MEAAAVEEKAGALLPADVISGLTEAAWKERLAAVESLTKFIESKETIASEEACVMVKLMGLRTKNWKETNFQVSFASTTDLADCE